MQGRNTGVAIACVLVVWWALAFRLATPDFLDDDFDHLSKARQVLFGEWPDRDFYDDGRPLVILASAAVQWVSPTLRSELLFRAGAIAVGVGVVFLLAYTLSGSTWLALAAALFAIAMRPRLYNYPKVLLLPVVVWWLWRYLDSPSRARLLILAGLTVIAVGSRHDYGIYVALAVTVTLLVSHRRDVLRPLALYAGVVLVTMSPYLVWLGVNGRLLESGVRGSAALVQRLPGVTPVPFRLDLSRGLVHVGPAPPRLTIRWRLDTSPAVRADVERQFSLEVRDVKSDGRSVLYALPDAAPERLQTLLAHPAVEDTAGIDRGDGHLLPLTGWNAWLMRLPLLRLEPSALFPTREGAEGWIYYVMMVLPVLAFWRVWWAPAPRWRYTLVLAVVCLVIDQFLLIGQLEPRLPDVAGLSAVLAAGLLADGWPARWKWTSGLMALVLGVVTVVTISAVTTFTKRPVRESLTAGLISPATIATTLEPLGRRPLDYWTAEKSIGGEVVGIPALARYLNVCLPPTDRPLIVAYAPQVYYLSERLFAGGINSFVPVGFNPTSAQILKWLRGQSVPLVVLHVRDRSAFEAEWTDLAAYLRQQYVSVGETTFGAFQPFEIRVDRARAYHQRDLRWDLPCFVAG